MLSKDQLRPGSPFCVLFHQAWGQAKESPEYDKSIWTQMDLLLFSEDGVRDPNASSNRTLLDLSTAHVPNYDPDFGDVRYEQHEYGWIVWVTDLDEGSDWLRPILAEAKKRGCVLVLLDQDGPTFDGLETYDW